MSGFYAVLKREFLAYFRTPVAYIFIVIFLLTCFGMTFFLGNFFEANQADLSIFFSFHPWLYLILAPAIGMRLWAEERRHGTVELLLTLPVSLEAAVLAKFFAAWGFLTLGLLLTFPLWITVNYLGDPDNGVIVAGYLGSILMAGAYLSVTSLTSALTKNQVVSFVVSIVVCFLFVLISWGVFADALSDWTSVEFADFFAALGFMSHFQNVSRGIIDLQNIVYFLSFSVVCLFGTRLAVENLRSR